MKTDKIKLQQYIFRIQLVMVIALALVLGIAGIFINIREESLHRDQNLQNVAEAIAHSNPVSMAAKGGPSQLLTDYLDSLKESLSDIDVISVVGEGSIRLYHSNHELIGTVFDGTMPDFENNGQYYAVNDSGPSGIQRRAYAAIYSEDGDPAGFVMAIMLRSKIVAKTLRILIIFAVVIVAAILVELVISYNISRKIRESLMGYEPNTFLSMFRIRENILESLEEGIVAVNARGEVQYVNSAANAMIKDPKTGEVSGSIGETLLSHTLLKGEKEFSVPVNMSSDIDIIMDRIPVKDEDKINGAIGILHNRTEYTRLAEDLAGTRFLVDSMRANNHDFTNKLHVILGLLRMEMYDKAINYIEGITIVQRETISGIMHKVSVPSIAALLIGKNARASELNVKFVFKKDSHFSSDDLYIPEDVLITVIGNLIDNALDSMNNLDSEHIKELYFGIYSSPEALLITSDDTGCGISEENLKHIFENGFSTKGSGRGTGLYQVRNLVESYGGTISVESQDGCGTSFTVSFTQGR